MCVCECVCVFLVSYLISISILFGILQSNYTRQRKNKTNFCETHRFPLFLVLLLLFCFHSPLLDLTNYRVLFCFALCFHYDWFHLRWSDRLREIWLVHSPISIDIGWFEGPNNNWTTWNSFRSNWYQYFWSYFRNIRCALHSMWFNYFWFKYNMY